MTIQAHAQAVLDRLTSSGSPALNVLDGKVPQGTVPPYVLVYFTVATPGGEMAPDKVSINQLSDVVEMSAYCHCVGGNGAAARALTSRVRTALLNQVLSVSGRVCLPVKHTDNYTPDRDETTGATFFDVVDIYRLTSVPA